MKKWPCAKWFFPALVIFLLVGSPLTVITATGDEGWARDPFAYGKPPDVVLAPVEKSPVAEDNKKAAMKVKGIFTSPDGHLIAIIDDKEYVSGDHIGDALIKNIEPFGVVLIEDGITRRIGLFGPNVEWSNYDD